MILRQAGRLTGMLMAMSTLVLGLGGCIDASMDVEVTGAGTARATMTQVMTRSVYDMIQSTIEKPDKGASPSIAASFCKHGTLALSDKAATCTLVQQGPIASTSFGSPKGDPMMTVEAIGGGRVRVSFSTPGMMDDLASGEEKMDAETRAMLQSFFDGHTITLRVTGGTILETNMDLAKDGLSAARDIAFVDLINGTADLPAELYAVVQK